MDGHQDRHGSRLLTSGEFAALCRVSKDTLFYYEKEGLIKPSAVGANGYRYYRYPQFLDFDTIRFLRGTGCTVEEIKTVLQSRDKAKLKGLFATRRDAVEAELERLKQSLRLLEDLTEIFEAHDELPLDAVIFKELGSAHLELFTAKMAGVLAYEGEHQELNFDLYSWMVEQYLITKRVPRPPFGIILSKDYLLEGRWVEEVFFCRADPKTPRRHRLKTPKGLFAMVRHFADAKGQHEFLKYFVEEVKKTHVIAGDAILYDTAENLLYQGESCFHLIYTVPVVPKV